MRSTLIVMASVVLVACATSPVGEKTDGFDEALESVNAGLDEPAFQAGAVSVFEKTGPCKASYRSTWAKPNSIAKGFAAVETAVPVEFSVNVQTAEHVPAYDDIKPDRIERWAESIRLVLAKPVAGVFRSMPIGESRMAASEYTVEFVTVGVSTTATESQIARLVQDLNRVIEVCHGASG